MKRIFLPLCAFMLLTVTFFSCQKDVNSTNNPTANSTYYIKCKIDGTARSFTANTMAHLMDYGAGMGSGLNLVAGASTTSSEGINIGINFSDQAPATGTYQEDDSNNDYEIGGVYNPGSTTVVYGAGTTAHSALPLSVTVTQIDSKEMSGTFKGAFYKTNIATAEISTEHITITEGEFKLPISK